jgi:hypothetical protein
MNHIARQAFAVAHRLGVWGSARRLVGHRGQPLRQNIGRARRRVLVRHRLFLLFLRDHQDFFEAAQSGGGMDANVQKGIRAAGDAGHDSSG